MSRTRKPHLPPITTSATEKILRDPEFQNLVADVRRGGATFFIGAGAAFDVGLPDAQQLAKELVSEAPKDIVFEDRKREQYQLSRVAALFENAGHRPDALNLIKDRVTRKTQGVDENNLHPYERGLYRLLPLLGEPEDFNGLTRVIYTTNWDELLEKAFEGKPCEVIRPNRHSEIKQGTHHIVKLHGDFTNTDTGEFVLSDCDYAIVRYLIEKRHGGMATLWGKIAEIIGDKHVIFVGYRDADSSTRLIKEIVKSNNRNAELHHYFVGPFSPTELVAKRDWDLVRPHFVRCTATTFMLALAQELAWFENHRDELDSILKNNAPTVIQLCEPPGMGLGAFIDELKGRAIGKGWNKKQIIHIDCCDEPVITTSDVLVSRIAKELPDMPRGRSRVEKVTKGIRDAGQLMLILEHPEVWVAHDPKATAFMKPLVEAIRGSSQLSRVIIASHSEIEGFDVGILNGAGKFERIELMQLGADEIRNMVEKYVLLRDEKAAAPRPTEKLIEQIYELTGGHPDFIKAVLGKLFDKYGSVLPSELENSEIEQFYDDFVTTTIHPRIWANVGGEYEQMFADGLCVLRCLQQETLRLLSKADEFKEALGRIATGMNETLEDVENSEQPDNVANELRCRMENTRSVLEDCKIVTQVAGLPRTEKVFRWIYGRALRRRRLDRFADCHKAASIAWQKIAKEGTARDSTQASIIIEHLFHEASHMICVSPEDPLQVLRGLMDQIPFRRQYEFEQGFGNGLVQRILGTDQLSRPDIELIDVLRICLRGDLDGFLEYLRDRRDEQ